MPHTSSCTDEELVVVVRDQDQEQYAHLVRRYQTKLLRYTQYLTGDQHLAQDIVQQSFINAFINLNSFNTKQKFSSWLYRIAHNQAINAIKKHRDVHLEINHWHNLEDTVNIEADYSQKELKTILRQSLNKLPLKYRAPLVLCYLQDRSYQDISDILRLPLGTVGTRINRGKKILKTVYQQTGGD